MNHNNSDSTLVPQTTLLGHSNSNNNNNSNAGGSSSGNGGSPLPPPVFRKPPPFDSGVNVEEIKLFSSTIERDNYENLADLYAIIVSVEYLEKAYVRDSITAAEYTPNCAKLIAQFKTALNLVRDKIVDVEEFMNEYKLSCPAAVNRLLKVGVPATIEHAANLSHDPSQSAKYVAETVQHFITLMDSLRLKMLAVDQIHPLLSDLIQSINNVTILPPDFAPKEKIKEWLIKLNSMKASEELNEDQMRQLLFDLENAHNAFYRQLSDKK